MDSDDSCCERAAGEDEDENEAESEQRDKVAQGDVGMDQADVEERYAKRQKIAQSSADTEARASDTFCEGEDELAQCERFIAAVAAGELVEFPPLDATALYTTVCKLNHSCSPNCEVTFENSSGAAAVLKVHK